MSDTDKNKGIVKDQVLYDTYRLDEEKTNLYEIQKPYRLKEAEFVYLKSESPWSKRFATVFLGSFVAYSVLFGGKALYLYKSSSAGTSGTTKVISGWELWVIAISLGLMILAYGIGALLPSKKKKVMKEIEDHFKANPSFAEVRRRR